MIVPDVAAGDTPFEAVTTNAYAPASVGVPENVPPDANTRPGGTDPDVTANVGPGEPAALNRYEYDVPTVAVGGVSFTNVGAEEPPPPV